MKDSPAPVPPIATPSNLLPFVLPVVVPRFLTGGRGRRIWSGTPPISEQSVARDESGQLWKDQPMKEPFMEQRRQG